MKRMIICLLCGAITFPFKSFSQEQNGFEITGHQDGLADGEMVKLGNLFSDWHEHAWMDSCKSKNGDFHLKGSTVPEGPRIYEIYFFPKTKGAVPFMDLFIDNGQKITIHCGDMSIEGSPTTTARNGFMPVVKEIVDAYEAINSRLPKIRDSIGYERQLIGQQISNRADLDKKVDSITKSLSVSSPRVVPLFMNLLDESCGGYHAAFIQDLYNSLGEAVKSGYEGKKFKEHAKLAVGQPFPDFNLADPAGNKIGLESKLPKGKITLVHFWATNSVDVEHYQKELLFFYHKYHRKGLNVIGVSADTSVNDWRSAIQQKKYPWMNVIAEPRGWMEGSLINDVYHEGGHGIPNTTNVLLDGKGKILAWDVEGAVLEYYLEKLSGK